MKKLSKFLVVVSLVLLPEVSFGSSSSESGFNFNPEIFSLSKKKESVFDAPSAAYIVSSEEIRRSGLTSIPEALRLVPGLQVARISGNQWAISARGSNAQYSNKLLVLIDGRIIYTPLFSGVFWDSQDYVMEDIDRIEVVRGPGGTIWGSNAVNGVINIITKSATQTQGAYFSQIAGDQDKSVTEVRYGGKTKSNDDYRVYAKKAVRDGLERYDTRTNSNDGNHQDRVGFRYDISSVANNSVSLHGDIYHGRAHSYFPTLTNSNINGRYSKGGNMVLNWDHKLSKKSNFSLNTYFDYDQFDMIVLKRSARTYDIDFQHFYNFSKENQFIWGLGYRRVNDDIEESKSAVTGTVPLEYTPDRLNSYVYSGFVQDKIGLIADELYLTVGSKFLNNNFTGFEYQPNAKLAYYPSRTQTVWASVSRAVRTPTRGEAGLNLSGAQKGNIKYGSENLMAYELGYRIKPSRKFSVDATTFFNQYRNLRTFEKNNSNNADNNGYGESYGFEVATKWRATDKWNLEFDYDFLKTTLHVNGFSTDNQQINGTSLQMAEGQSPQNQFKIKSFYNLTPKLEFDNVLYYVDKLKTGTALTTNGAGHIPSYFRFDTRFGYLPTKNLDLSVGVQNLLDQRHSEFKKALFNRQTQVGRTFYVKMVWQY